MPLWLVFGRSLFSPTTDTFSRFLIFFVANHLRALFPLWNIILFDITKMDPYAIITKDNVGKYEYLKDL